MRVLGVHVCLVILFWVFPAGAVSRVIVEDMIAVEDEQVMLRAETKGRLFSKGGQLVEFFVDEESLGKTLSGGDGVAFKPFTPTKTGLHQVRVRSGEAEDTGLLRSLKQGSGIVFVDVEGCLLDGPITREPRQGSQNAIRMMCEKFPIVFLQSGFVSLKATKKWLKEHEFVELPVIAWRGGAVFDRILEKGLSIEAIIASPKVIESAREHKALSFSFRPVDDAKWVKDWDEIGRLLN